MLRKVPVGISFSPVSSVTRPVPSGAGDEPAVPDERLLQIAGLGRVPLPAHARRPQSVCILHMLAEIDKIGQRYLSCRYGAHGLMPEPSPAWPPSLWAAVTPPGPALPEVQGSVTADVVVIGAGFTGLSTALHLREAGVDVAVVEAAEPGWGASGRNNGQVIPTLSRPDPEDIVARHGAAGERFVALLRDSASVLFDVAHRYRIEA